MTLGQNDRSGARIARNDQQATDPFQNFWDGRRDGRNLWIGIRDCNIFLENIHRVPDITVAERLRWISEVKFIKAHLHFFLLKLYGPIPIVNENLLISSPTEAVRVFRDPVDDVIDFIVNLLDEAMEYLPEQLMESAAELGRITQPIAAAVKAYALVWAASPLFNGNPDYANFRDSRGVHLFSTTHDNTKWERALIAIDEAIELAHKTGHTLFEFNPGVVQMSETTRLKYTLRGAVSERPMNHNNEVIWAHPARNDANQFANFVMPKWAALTSVGGVSEVGATLKMAEMFYTKNGVPIIEDLNWNWNERYEVRRDTGEFHQFYIRRGEATANLNFYREPRFYAHLSFNRGLYEMLAQPEAETVMIESFSGRQHGLIHNNAHIMTGYFIKKIVSFRTATNTSGASPFRYNFPNIRLADLYLLRAEAANEVKDTPDNEVWYWIDLVRQRAGLNGVVESWQNHSNEPLKPTNKIGMRKIIKQERAIELSFEGKRGFDLRRWGDAIDELNQPMQGWDYRGTSVEEYYRVMTYFSERHFTTKDYLWPLWQTTLIRNNNLMQNPGW
jgi:hypothetical protein